MQASGSGAKLAEGQGAKALGAYDRFWMKHINQVFGDDLELLRCRPQVQVPNSLKVREQK